jgi:hypothetical protein
MPDRLAARAAGAADGEMKRCVTALAALMLSACGSTPVYGPGILVLPGSGKSFDQFRADEQDCRGYAQTQLAKSDAEYSAGPVQQRYDRSFVQCMYAKGHKVPVSGRYSDSTESAKSAGVTAPPPPPPPGQPPADAPPDYRPK